MNFSDAKNQLKVVTRIMFWMLFLLGAPAILCGALIGAWDFVFVGLLIAVLLPLLICVIFVIPLWDCIDAMRAAGRICPLAVFLIPSLSAVPAIVFPCFRPPRLIPG